MNATQIGPQTRAQKIGPSRWFHLIGIALLAAGFFGGYKTIVSALHLMEGNFTRGVFPGEMLVTFKTPGTYKIYYESVSELDGRVFDTGAEVPGLPFHVTSVQTGQDIPLRVPAYSETYEVNGRRGRAVFQFHVGEPGEYRVEAQYKDGESHEDAVFAVGNLHIFRLFLMIFTAAVYIFVLGAAGAALIAVIEIRRSSSKRKLQAAGAAPVATAPPV